VAVVAVVAVTAVVVLGGGSDKADEAGARPATNVAAPATAPGEPIAIPVADLGDGQVHFFETTVDDVAVKYLAVKSPDGTIRTSLDACQVCFQARKGYSQQGDTVVCGNCGRSFPIDQIGVQHGGCNPIAIRSTVKDGRVLIDPAAIGGGIRFFQ
jgi:uncharacterized membrane protein